MKMKMMRMRNNLLIRNNYNIILLFNITVR
nr:MAG TPA: hypothetical protein [Bacteriophage sp.]